MGSENNNIKPTLFGGPQMTVYLDLAPVGGLRDEVVGVERPADGQSEQFQSQAVVFVLLHEVSGRVHSQIVVLKYGLQLFLINKWLSSLLSNVVTLLNYTLKKSKLSTIVSDES